jgi:hypothetical protein
MPTYHARGISVRLGAMPLAETTTSNIELRKGEIARRQCEEAEQKLLGSELLHETRVGFPGDENGFELNWLGGAPFMQVQAGDNSFEDESDETFLFPRTTMSPKHLRRLLTPDWSNNDPLALSLHVNLSDNTFISGMDKQRKVHLKIDVFFNGQLSSCLFVPPHDIRSGAKSLHQVFAGYRSDYLVERPWVILPPQKIAENTLRSSKSFLPAENRWNDICQALRKEADERGVDEQSNIPPSAKFLKALAMMQLPDQAKSMQRPGSKAFGVVDVVITAGYGRKVTSGTGYLKAPQRLTDENFPVRVVQGGTAAKAFSSDQVEAKSEVARNFPAPITQDVDRNAKSESDYIHEPLSKRQTLASNVPSILPRPKAVHSYLSQKLARDAKIPITPEEVLDMSQSTLVSDSIVSESTIRSFKPKQRLQHSMSSPERERANQEFANFAVHANFADGTSKIPHSFYSLASSNITLAGTPQMRPSPYSFRSSDPVLGLETPKSPMNIATRDGAGLLSSPLRQAINTNSPFPEPLFSQRQHGENTIQFDQRRTSTPAPTEWPDPPMIDPHMPSFMPAVPLLRPPYPVLQPLQASQSPVHVPDMLSFSSTFGHTMFGGPTYPPPYIRQPSMPLPPTGLFSVPTKPRSSLSPSRKPQSFAIKKSQRYLLVRRLIIIGKNREILVDHKWPTARRIDTNNDDIQFVLTPKNSPSDSLENPSGSVMLPAASMIGQNCRKSTVQSNTKYPPFDAKEQRSELELQDGGGTPNVESLGAVLLRDVQAEVALDVPGTTTEVLGSSQQRARRDTRINDKAVIPQRRTVSGTNILGVQGPKATPFWLEDPEEILREVAKQRRYRSPIKSSHKPSTAIRHTASGQAAPKLDFYATGSSSPLSSVPTTPEPEAGPTLGDPCIPIIVPSNIEATESIPQFDGSPERKLIGTSPPKFTPSPTKLGSASTPQLAPKPQSTLQSSSSPNLRKRKAQGRSLPKQSRSPDRLMAVGNPPLNQNCVIAFAESENQDSERSILRQVKGERQGVFAEDYVVYAARFFIAGN